MTSIPSDILSFFSIMTFFAESSYPNENVDFHLRKLEKKFYELSSIKVKCTAQRQWQWDGGKRIQVSMCTEKHYKVPPSDSDSDYEFSTNSLNEDSYCTPTIFSTGSITLQESLDYIYSTMNTMDFKAIKLKLDTEFTVISDSDNKTWRIGNIYLCDYSFYTDAYNSSD